MKKRWTKKNLPYREGDWFAVPLRSGGYAIGVAARLTKRPGGILGYFFGPRRDTVPSLDEVTRYRPEQSLSIQRFGDLALLEGEWPIIGRQTDWDRSQWPVPLFARHDLLRDNAAWVVEYADDDPDQVNSETPVKLEDVRYLPRDGTSGAGAVEITLTELIEESEQAPS